MAKVHIRYNETMDLTELLVEHKRKTMTVASFKEGSDAYNSAKFLTRVFHEITMKTMDACHKRALKAIQECEKC